MLLTRLSELYYRAQRLLHCQFRQDDLYVLVLGLRERNFGKQTVRELGDFVAHNAIRTRGPIAHEVRIFYKSMRLQISLNFNVIVDENRFPQDIREILDYNLSRIDKLILKNGTGLGRIAAQLHLNKFIKDLRQNSAGEWKICRKMTNEEIHLVHFLLDTIVVQPYFTEELLWNEFCAVIVKNQLIEERQVHQMEKIKPLFAIFVLSILHGSKFEIEKGWSAYLYIDQENGDLCVKSISRIFRNKDPLYFIYTPLRTSLSVEKWYDGALSSSPSENWKRIIEVSAGMRLVTMGEQRFEGENGDDLGRHVTS